MTLETRQDTGRQIALITGGNKGLGYETARQLAERGCTVVLGARDRAMGEDAAKRLTADGADVHSVVLDVTDAASVEAAAKSVEKSFGRIDILVNNAGITDPKDGPPMTSNPEAIERILRTNFLGAVVVTQAMLPLVRKSEAGRVVNVSSGLGSLTDNGDPGYEFAQVKVLGYNASKAALNMLTVQLAFLLRDTSIKVNSADPGLTATDLNQHRGHQTVEEGAAVIVKLALLPEDGPTGGFFADRGPVAW